ncbi:ATPase inhibitor, mitochondrial [Orchesella cincta]|uniref:ATPase inhibitor, mitochondrial n=1 Tax=Orchesella cincta TaxID=48709 RepID=A0A1D2MIJ0_ORCCI|nr:ATPase inhibitor, mitochondrial [Orchesella cincta]
MMSVTRISVFSRQAPALASRASRAMYCSDPKEGGAGSIREAGGAFAKREAALEDQYFRKLQQEQLAKLKGHVNNEIEHHQKEIKRHQEAIEKLTKRSKDLGK